MKNKWKAKKILIKLKKDGDTVIDNSINLIDNNTNILALAAPVAAALAAPVATIPAAAIPTAASSAAASSAATSEIYELQSEDTNINSNIFTLKIAGSDTTIT
jgi:hypothetical protein